MAEKQCGEYVDTEILDRYSLIPAFIVVIILHAFQYHKEKKLQLVPPFLSLIGDSDKKMIAVGFGAMTSSIFVLIFEGFKAAENTWGQITIHMVLFVVRLLVISIVNYPIFMCLQFNYKFVSSILGELYVLYRLTLLLLQNTYLKNCQKEESRRAINLALIFPNFLCLLVLISKFFLSVVKCIRQRNFGKTINATTIAAEKELKHLREVLCKHKLPDNSSIASQLVRIVKDTSKLSTFFLLAIVIIVIIYYDIVVLCIYIGRMISNVTNPNASSELFLANSKMMIKTFNVGHSIGATVSILMYLGILFQLIRSHEQDLKDLFAGKKTLHGDMVNLHPQSLTMSSIVFPGFLVAYMVWGLVSLYLLVMICSAVIYVIAYFATEFNLLDKILIAFLKSLYRILLVPSLVYIVQWLMTKFLFCQRDSNELVMLRNIKLYHITIYFNFFYNIVMGVLSCLKRSLTGFAINFLFLGRIDRTPFAFFKRFDAGYRAYIGFMRLEALYKNPIMRCFIQFVSESTSSNENDFFQQTAMTEQLANSTFKRARNRWHLAYTLIHNQSLINQRIHHKPKRPSFKYMDDDGTSIYSDTCSQTNLVFI